MTGNLVKIQRASEPQNLATQLRSLADRIENGEQPARTVVVIIDDRESGDLIREVYGYRPRVSDELGMLEFTKSLVWESRHG